MYGLIESTRLEIVELESYDKDKKAYFYRDDIFRVEVSEEMVLKKAANKEDLCDGFYVDIDNQPFDLNYCYVDLKKAKRIYNELIICSKRTGLQYTATIYGFVKTKEGLIFILQI